MAEPVPPPRRIRPEVAEAAGFPTIGLDRLTIGQEFRSDDRLIRPQDVEAYAAAIGDDDDLFFEPGPLGPPLAHPTLLANQALFLRHNHFTVPAGLHARMVFEFVAPIPLGTRARTIGRVVDTYRRRGKPYMVTGYETRSETGDLLVRGRFVQMLFDGDTAPAAGSDTGPRPEPERPALDQAITTATGRDGRPLSTGQPVGPLTRPITQRGIDIYSGVKPGSIHTDPDWARAKGFADTIAQGMMTTAFVSNLMTGLLGMGFVVGGGMDVRFLRPVVCGDALTVTGTIDGFSPDPGDAGGGPPLVHASVRAVNQRDETTMAGSAWGRCGRT